VLDPHVALALALAALVAGATLAALLARATRLFAALDGFVLAVVAGLCAGSLLPDALGLLGTWAIPLAVVGFLGPLLAERRLHRHQPGEAPIVLLGALAALLVHEALDGVGLAVDGAHAHGAAEAVHEAVGHEGHDHYAAATGGSLTLAILAHRLPVGLLVWWSVEPTLGRRAMVAVLAAMAAATTGGFFLAEQLQTFAQGTGAGVVHALLAGALLHVVLDHGPEPKAGAAPASALRAWAGVGAIVGGVLCAALPLEWGQAARDAARSAVELFQEAAPALLIGFAGAGLLSLVPTGAMAKLMTGATTFGSALRGTIFGLPLPVCSCGVVPLYRELSRQGVPPAAATSFLVATPELGVDAVAVSVPLLGIPLTLARLGSAVVLALVAGLVAGKVGRQKVPGGGPGGDHAGHGHDHAGHDHAGHDHAGHDHAGHGHDHDHGEDGHAHAHGHEEDPGHGHDHDHDHAGHDHAGHGHEEEAKDDCCAVEAPRKPLGQRLKGALRYAAVDTVDEIGPWVVAGILAAGVLAPTLDAGRLTVVPAWAQVPLAVLIGAPIYVCASAATPFAAVLIAKGLSPGAAIAFLLTGPATNVTTWGALRAHHDRRSASWIVAAILIACTVIGLGVNLAGIGLPESTTAAAAAHTHEHGPLTTACSVAVLALLLGALVRQGPRGLLARVGLVHRHGHDPAAACEPAPTATPAQVLGSAPS